MKILITGDSIYPDTMGGSHRTIYDTCFCLAKEGHDVVALIPTKNETLPRDEKKDGFRIIRYLRNRRNKLADLNSYIDRAKDSFEELSKNWVPDIVHGNWPLPVFGIYKSKSAKGIPLVFTFHGPWPEEYLYEISGKLKIIKPILFKYFRNIERSVLKRANQIIVASNFMKELGTNIYGKDVFGNAVIVTPGVDSSRYTKYQNIPKSVLRDELNLSKDKKIIFTARRLYKRMGLENLTQSMVYIKKQRSDVLRLIAGKGILKDDLEKL
ncbi:MAG: glycosyltransferase family 4 protein, partial [Candidatus Staskawiczbacteria bacterium]|nr:glycosyltransferase family 4 protein [Candidatus Staskawiczbacteria bacterium]